ncbi:Shedu anti-phage system protein SduA domain-containing protein [Ensifer canadensis]
MSQGGSATARPAPSAPPSAGMWGRRRGGTREQAQRASHLSRIIGAMSDRKSNVRNGAPPQVMMRTMPALYPPNSLLSGMRGRFCVGSHGLIAGSFLDASRRSTLSPPRTRDPKAILVIGRGAEIEGVGTARDAEVRRDTFELFRRHTRSLDIVTFDELLERARFITRDRGGDGSP